MQIDRTDGTDISIHILSLGRDIYFIVTVYICIEEGKTLENDVCAHTYIEPT